MTNLVGVGVSPGRIIGTIRQMPHPLGEPPAGQVPAPGTTADDAVAALKAAAAEVAAELRGCRFQLSLIHI